MSGDEIRVERNDGQDTVINIGLAKVLVGELAKTVSDDLQARNGGVYQPLGPVFLGTLLWMVAEVAGIVAYGKAFNDLNPEERNAWVGGMSGPLSIALSDLIGGHPKHAEYAAAAVEAVKKHIEEQEQQLQERLTALPNVAQA